MPPLLLGAALLFWGWQTGFLPVAAVLAAILEGSRLTRVRWQFSQVDLNRIWNFCTLLFVGALAMAVISDQGMAIFDNSPRGNSPAARVQALNKTAKSVLLFFQWMPLVFFPIAAAQAYSRDGVMKLETFSWVLRRRAARRELFESGDANVMLPYFAVCLLAATTSVERSDSFFPGIVVLLAWALWAHRVRRFAPAIVALVIVIVCAAGYGGNYGIRELQRLATGLDAAFLSRFSGRDFNPREHRSLLGAIGRLKASGKIVLWVKTKERNPPPLLREAAYDQFASPVWHNSDRDFNNTPPENDQSTWKLTTNRPQHAVTISRMMSGNRGLLPFPNGTLELQHLMAFGLRTNSMAVLKADGPGYVSYDALYGHDAGIDSEPTDEDKRVPHKEMWAIAKIADELDLPAIAARDPRKAIQAVERFFQQNFHYSTHFESTMRPGTNRTAVTRFLLEHRKGHCEYFASATVLLLRQAGIPARYAVGHSVQEGHGGKYIVRERHAHAWCLAHINGAWTDVDTTPPGWNAIESQRAPWWEPISDAWSNLVRQISKLRWGGHNYRKYLIWSLIPAVAGVGILIYRRRQWTRSTPTAVEVPQPAPGLDSEFYLVETRLRELGFDRNSGEPLKRWLTRINGSAPRNGFPLEDLLQLHYRYRFDPAGLGTNEREVLKEKTIAWLQTAGKEAQKLN